MERNKFDDLLEKGFNDFNLGISREILNKFWIYNNFLRKENKKYNLTALDKPQKIITRHFLDSAAIFSFLDLKNWNNVLDLGTGAGFPGMVYKILFYQLDITLLDARLKRIMFLNKLLDKLSFSKYNLEILHGRAEEFSLSAEYREIFDSVVSRAVASLNILVEYSLPFVKKGGFFYAYKSYPLEKELKNAEKAIQILGGKIINNYDYKITGDNKKRTIIVLKKINSTPKKFPRAPGKAKKSPL